MTTIRITTRNNSDTRNFTVLDSISSATVKHNGGKVMVAKLDASDLAAAERLLDEAREVASYETT